MKKKGKDKLAPKPDPFIDWLFNLKAGDDLPEELEDYDQLESLMSLFADWRSRLEALPTKIQNKIVWRIIGYPLFVGMEIIDETRIPVFERCRLIRAMENVTLAIPFLHPTGEPMENGYFMWWDIIASSCRETETKQACFEVLSDLVQNPDNRIQVAALHGFGHLGHPQRSAAVEQFIKRQPVLDIHPEWRKWLEDCRDGKVM